MKRFYVCRHYIKWKGKLYKKGELLPENFTHHDKARNIYNSRIAECEVEETSAPAESSGSSGASPVPEVPQTPRAPLSGQQSFTPPTKPPASSVSAKGTVFAAGNPKVPTLTNPTGAPSVGSAPLKAPQK